MELVTKAEITIKIKPSEAMALLKIIDEYMLYKNIMEQRLMQNFV
jgi:hypothetical protein